MPQPDCTCDCLLHFAVGTRAEEPIEAALTSLRTPFGQKRAQWSVAAAISMSGDRPVGGRWPGSEL